MIAVDAHYPLLYQFRLTFHCPVDKFSALNQMIAWRRPCDKPLSEPMTVSLMTHICVTQPQWIYEWWQSSLTGRFKKGLGGNHYTDKICFWGFWKRRILQWATFNMYVIQFHSEIGTTCSSKKQITSYTLTILFGFILFTEYQNRQWHGINLLTQRGMTLFLLMYMKLSLVQIRKYISYKLLYKIPVIDFNNTTIKV